MGNKTTKRKKPNKEEDPPKEVSNSKIDKPDLPRNKPYCSSSTYKVTMKDIESDIIDIDYEDPKVKKRIEMCEEGGYYSPIINHFTNIADPFLLLGITLTN